MADEFVPIPFGEWAEANPELCGEERCQACSGRGIVGGHECECEECGDTHTAPEERCDGCRGKGIVSVAERNYKKQVAKDAKRYRDAVAAGLLRGAA